MKNIDEFTNYQLGRLLSVLVPPFNGQDKTFAAQRLDSETLENAIFKHCTFVNLSFKEASFKGENF
jgi:hypothetical protein